MKDDVQKLDFTIKALAMDDPFVSIPVVHADIRECLDWQKSRSADEIMKDRELMTQQIESSGCKLWESMDRCARNLSRRESCVSRVLSAPPVWCVAKSHAPWVMGDVRGSSSGCGRTHGTKNTT